MITIPFKRHILCAQGSEADLEIGSCGLVELGIMHCIDWRFGCPCGKRGYMSHTYGLSYFVA